MNGSHTAVQVKLLPAQERGKRFFKNRPSDRREKRPSVFRLRSGFRIKADPIHQIIGKGKVKPLLRPRRNGGDRLGKLFRLAFL